MPLNNSMFRNLAVKQLEQGDFEQRTQPPAPLLQAQLGRGSLIRITALFLKIIYAIAMQCIITSIEIVRIAPYSSKSYVTLQCNAL